MSGLLGLGRIQGVSDLPGGRPAAWRRDRRAVIGGALAAVAWPPLILTLLVWPPQNWMPGLDTDWRLKVLLIGLIALPLGLRLVGRQRDRTGRPGSRLGIVWRFVLYGGLLAAALQVLIALTVVVLGWVASASVAQAAGATETVLLIYGVGGLPVAILMGVSYALWAGLCVAFIAFEPAPIVPDRLGVLGGGEASVQGDL